MPCSARINKMLKFCFRECFYLHHQICFMSSLFPKLQAVHRHRFTVLEQQLGNRMQNVLCLNNTTVSLGFPKVCVAHCFPLGLRMMCERAAVILKHNKSHMITYCKCQVMHLCVCFAVPHVPKSQESQCENAVVREGVPCILPLISPKREKRKPRLAHVVLFHLLSLITTREDC